MEAREAPAWNLFTLRSAAWAAGSHGRILRPLHIGAALYFIQASLEGSAQRVLTQQAGLGSNPDSLCAVASGMEIRPANRWLPGLVERLRRGNLSCQYLGT